MFNELNSVENLIRDILCGPISNKNQVADIQEEYLIGSDKNWQGLGWNYTPSTQIPRQLTDVLVEEHLKAALIKLNSAIAAQPDRADEVIYKLRAILLSVNTTGLVRANEEFTSWLRAEHTLPFGPNNEHVTIKLIDFENWQKQPFGSNSAIIL